MKHVGETIKNFIEVRKLHKGMIASQVGITPTYLSAIFNKESIDCKLLESICKVIGLSPSALFDDLPNHILTVGDVSASTGIGTASVHISQGEVDGMKQLLDEKERTIQILMKSKGFNPE